MGLRKGGRARVVGFKNGRVELNVAADIEADALVIAVGDESIGLLHVAPELLVLRSIKGQILLFPNSTLTGRIVRFAGGYLCGGENGILLGATMEDAWTQPGFDDHGDAYLRGLAKRYAPVLADEWGQGAFGFRASTPDGLPLVGPSATPGVWLATGARRNGWLLAPMIAETLAREMTGGPGEPAFAPGRFTAPLARTGSGS
jgi:glycine oxidase